MDPAREPDPPWRPDLFVVARFLDRLWHEEGSSPPRWPKARLQPAVRLNYDLFQRYLRFLEDRGLVLVRATNKEKLVELAPGGRVAYHRFVVWMREVFGPGAFGPRQGHR